MLEEIAGAVRAGTISPRELVEASLSRIERLNADLNAVVGLRAEEALAVADAHPRTGPLAGVPMLVKNLLDVRGMVTTHGGFSPVRHNPPATRTDPSMEALERLGAIIVGVSNSPGFGLLTVTTNEMHGPTRNPWNTSRTAGGSSGGAAASLASGMVPLSNSSDGGGSTRIPAATCGLVGLKPTSTVFRATRPPNPPWWTNGAMGATVADVVHEARCMADTDASRVDFTPRTPRRAYAVSSLRHRAPPADLQRVFDAACALLADELGIEVVPITRPFPDDLIENFEVVFNSHVRDMIDGLGVAVDRCEPAQQWAHRYAEARTASDLRAALDGGAVLNRILEDLLGEDEVLITLPQNIHAPGPMGVPDGADTSDPGVVMAIIEEELDGGLNTMDFNLSGAPACAVPIGFDDDGLPVGLQVAAKRFDDALVLGLAREIETARPWPLVAPGHEPFTLDTI